MSARLLLPPALLVLAAAPVHGAQATAPPADRPTATGLPSTLPLRRGPEPGLASQGMGVLPSLTLVVLLALLAAWVLRSRGPGGKPGSAGGDWWSRLVPAAGPDRLKVVQSTRLTQRASVHLVQWDGKEWMVGCSETGLTVLGQRPLLAEPKAGAAGEGA